MRWTAPPISTVAVVAIVALLRAKRLHSHAAPVTANAPVERLRELKILPDPALTPDEINQDVTQENIADTWPAGARLAIVDWQAL